MSVYNVRALPEVDRAMVDRGLCPWCVERLVDLTLCENDGDECPECGDVFVSKEHP